MLLIYRREDHHVNLTGRIWISSSFRRLAVRGRYAGGYNGNQRHPGMVCWRLQGHPRTAGCSLQAGSIASPDVRGPQGVGCWGIPGRPREVRRPLRERPRIARQVCWLGIAAGGGAHTLHGLARVWWMEEQKRKRRNYPDPQIPNTSLLIGLSAGSHEQSESLFFLNHTESPQRVTLACTHHTPGTRWPDHTGPSGWCAG